MLVAVVLPVGAAALPAYRLPFDELLQLLEA